MANQEKTRPHLDESNQIEKDNDFHLILHNDDYNTFDFVIECLVEVCEHDSHQAEQCAYITHYKGKCDIKKGSFDYLKAYKDDLINKGLNVTIE